MGNSESAESFDTGSRARANSGQLSEQSRDKIKQMESFSPTFYQDGKKGQFSIGYGHHCPAHPGTCEQLKQPISREEGERLFNQDLRQYERSANNLPNADKLSQSQYDAVVKHMYNAGPGNTRAAIGDIMKRGDIDGVCDALRGANSTGLIDGKPVDLTSRREMEYQACKGGK
ncbi:lysozyme-like domain-containing protein [Kalaharituber pfeilii]|nr:lysozyme-like domain-containing protein [Kalaharituber pfeilii]